MKALAGFLIASGASYLLLCAAMAVWSYLEVTSVV